jgi:hypothetical protein
MQTAILLQDKHYPFEKMLNAIRKKKPLGTVKVTFFEIDGDNDLLYKIEGDFLDGKEILAATIGEGE